MFRLSNETKSYFKTLKSKLKLEDFAVYYYCAVIGLLSKEFSEVPHNADVFVQRVPSDFWGTIYYELILLLISTEIKRIGTDYRDRTAMKNLCNDILSSEGYTSLTDNGIKLLNQYCQKGFEIIKQKRIELVDEEVFYIDYYKLVNELSLT